MLISHIQGHRVLRATLSQEWEVVLIQHTATVVHPETLSWHSCRTHASTHQHPHMHQAHLVDLWWWQLGGPPVHGPLDNVLRRASPIIFLSTIPGLPTGREELDGGVAPDLEGEGKQDWLR